MIPIYPILFYCFSGLLIVSALMVVLARQPVHSILFLVLCFFASAALWMMLQAEFLSLVLIFVYVGAVMTLFLFVVMMLNLNSAQWRERVARFLPFALLALIILVGLMALSVSKGHAGNWSHSALTSQPLHYSHTVAMGMVLFGRFLYAFEIAALLLLVAMISAITLVFTGPRGGTKVQSVPHQQRVTKANRLQVVKMKGKKS